MSVAVQAASGGRPKTRTQPMLVGSDAPPSSRSVQRSASCSAPSISAGSVTQGSAGQLPCATPATVATSPVVDTVLTDSTTRKAGPWKSTPPPYGGAVGVAPASADSAFAVGGGAAPAGAAAHR